MHCSEWVPSELKHHNNPQSISYHQELKQIQHKIFLTHSDGTHSLQSNYFNCSFKDKIFSTAIFFLFLKFRKNILYSQN